MSVNRATLIGNVGKNPEIKAASNGNKFARFSLATTERFKDKTSGDMREKTQWHNIVVWNEGLVGIIEKYVKKGSKLYIEGNIETREWHKDGTPEDDKRYSTDIVLNPFGASLQLLDKPTGNRPPDPDGPDQGRPVDRERSGYAAPPSSSGGGQQRRIDDEIPF